MNMSEAFSECLMNYNTFQISKRNMFTKKIKKYFLVIILSVIVMERVKGKSDRDIIYISSHI